MNLEIHFHQMESTPAIKSHIEAAVQKLERYLEGHDHVKFVVGANGHHNVYAEIFWHDQESGKDLFAKEEANQGQDLYALVDVVVEKVFHQLHKHHDKKLERRQKKDPIKKTSASH